MKLIRLFLIMGYLTFALSACSPQDQQRSDLNPDVAYQEWRQQVNSILGDKPYILPQYDSSIGPFKIVFNASETPFSLDLYRSDAYEIQEELSGLHTAHDFYYSYSHSDIKNVLNDSEILSRFGAQDELADRLTEVQDGEIHIYEFTETDDSARQEAIITFLKKKEISSAQVLIVDMENHTNLEFHMVVDDRNVVISFSVREIDELSNYLEDLSL